MIVEDLKWADPLSEESYQVSEKLSSNELCDEPGLIEPHIKAGPTERLGGETFKVLPWLSSCFVIICPLTSGCNG
jgi:hypothetical protein